MNFLPGDAQNPPGSAVGFLSDFWGYYRYILDHRKKSERKIFFHHEEKCFQTFQENILGHFFENFRKSEFSEKSAKHCKFQKFRENDIFSCLIFFGYKLYTVHLS